MGVTKCPECGEKLTEEMIESNMCWECGHIIDESLLDEETLSKIENQAVANNPFSKKEIREHKLTTGYSFDRYTILEYKGLVSGEIVFGTGFMSDVKAGFSDLFGAESKSYSGKMKQGKKAALYDMIQESLSVGGNAIIGVSYDFITLSGNMIGVSANGTAVVISEKN